MNAFYSGSWLRSQYLIRCFFTDTWDFVRMDVVDMVGVWMMVSVQDRLRTGS